MFDDVYKTSTFLPLRANNKRYWAEASSADASDLTFCLPNRVTSKFQRTWGIECPRRKQAQHQNWDKCFAFDDH